jgi:hypothetical protein
MSADNITFKSLPHYRLDAGPAVPLAMLCNVDFTAGNGLRVARTQSGEHAKLLSSLVGALSVRQLPSVSYEDFMSIRGRRQYDRLTIDFDTLGRCALEVLNAVRSCLTASGFFLIYQVHDRRTLGTEDLRSKPRGESSAFRWLVCLQQAERCGFDVVCSYSLMVDHQSPAPVDRAWVSLAVARRATNTEVETKLSLGTLSNRHATQVCQLFGQVFAPANMTPAHWEWKYANGRGAAVGAWRSDQLVAHYGGVWRPVILDGRTQLAVQISDVMVSPRERGVMGRRGAFSVVAPSFAECFVGYGAHALIGFGFPNERHFKAAEKRGLYGEVDRIVEVRWPAGRVPLLKAWAPLRVKTLRAEEIESSPIQVNDLWHRMRSGLEGSIVGVRDHDYLIHRYIQNPLHRYEYVVFQSLVLKRWVGLAVMFASEACIEVRDVIARPAHIRQCLVALCAEARRRQRDLKLWITRSHKDYCWIPGGIESDTGIVVPISTWTNGPSVEEIRGRWWLTSGDTDFL